MTDQPAWQLILTAARQLTTHKLDFSRAELIDEVQRLDPTRHPQSLGPVIQGMTRDTTGGPPSPCGTPLIRLERGRYTLADSGPSPSPGPQPVIPAQHPGGRSGAESAEPRADIALIGCVKTKLDHPVPAHDLYVSPLFIRRRTYVERHARRYYILSAEHGLVAPETVIAPYDTALAQQSKDYRRAWGQWVAAKLMRAESQVRDRVVEIHAGDEYAQAIAPLLTQAGATVRRPLAGLTFGEQLAWYGRQPHPPAPEQLVALAKQSRETIRPLAPTGIPVPVQPDARAIVTALLKYGREHQAERAGTPPRFTPHPEANTLILSDPFAFLLAVIFDQGIPAERAWKAPYDLRQRLGHLDPARMTAEPEQVRAAVAQPRALHRFVNNMPGWLVAAAIIIVNEYGGDASRIWADEPRATDLATRLRRFPGIAQKKSAMAVEILARDLAVPIRELSGTDIAYDVHVRRVFLRTRLAERDDLDHMVEVARWLHPERPGELDFPAWLIGRRWCGPGTPDCGTCPLRSICPKDIAQAAAV
ncbi:hypothetical protein J5U46_09410 [Micromonospora tulbaghiae]|uniref:HhH-GPD domain-containing protein n=1 Tax=Micromonospora tulbaghiae TaxID=479978 RepID=A0AAW4JEU3_9ACTN|nr:DUF6884 domain-containing protein [Micromonospora tulbaghiae]MBO4140358.1 hypothetical protein [Micromonospora tulbaghiae]